MFIALEKHTGEAVPIEAARNGDSSSYICPVCRNSVIIKNGKLVTPHFAHKAGSDCDSFTADMSEWHRNWQNVFPKKNQEYVMQLDISRDEYVRAANNWNFTSRLNKENMDRLKVLLFQPEIGRYAEDKTMVTIRHRTDVRACGYAVEFQHSPISSEEFNERNWFYTACGLKVVWVFDFVDKREDGTMTPGEETGYSTKWKWKHASKTFVDFLPQDYKRHKDEDGKWKDSSILLFFQTTYCEDEGIGQVEQVTWAIDDDYGCADFRRFTTSLTNCFTKKEFRYAISKQML